MGFVFRPVDLQKWILGVWVSWKQARPVGVVRLLGNHFYIRHCELLKRYLTVNFQNKKVLDNRAMGQMIENMKSNENQVKYRIFDSRFNGTIFSMIRGISADLFRILKIWSRRSWKIMLGWFVWNFCWFISIVLLNFSVGGPNLWPC